MEKNPKTFLPPEQLVEAGNEWLLKQHMSEHSIEMNKHLVEIFGIGLEIFDANVRNIMLRIEKAGGINKILTIDSDFINGFQLENGDKIYASEITSIPLLKKDLPLTVAIDEAKQTYRIRALFGFFGPAERGKKIDSAYLTKQEIENLLEPQTQPVDIGIEESVISEFETWKKTYSRFYSLNAQVWEPSLPNDDGVRIGLGFAKADMVFTATKESKGKDGEINSEIFTYIDRGFVEGPRKEADEKLKRFLELLIFAHQEVTNNTRLLAYT